MAHVNLTLFDMPKTNGEANRIDPLDLPIHDWYRFVLSFPPHLARQYIKRFGLNDQSLVLDPFCGTGTTVVECKKNGIPAIGIEALPMPHFASAGKSIFHQVREMNREKYEANQAESLWSDY